MKAYVVKIPSECDDVVVLGETKTMALENWFASHKQKISDAMEGDEQ
jgi:hypothetical protein